MIFSRNIHPAPCATRGGSEQTEVQLQMLQNFFRPQPNALVLVDPEDDDADDEYDDIMMMIIRTFPANDDNDDNNDDDDDDDDGGVTVCLLVTTTTILPSGLSNPTI